MLEEQDREDARKKEHAEAQKRLYEQFIVMGFKPWQMTREYGFGSYYD